jgi:hypothetical protein
MIDIGNLITQAIISQGNKYSVLSLHLNKDYVSLRKLKSFHGDVMWKVDILIFY